MKTVADMVAEWLREHGYDGLTNGEDCACLAEDDDCPLFWSCLVTSQYSSGAGSVTCVPGHKVTHNGEEDDWDIVPGGATDAMPEPGMVEAREGVEDVPHDSLP